MPVGKLLIVAGCVLVAVGLWVTYGPRIPFLGKLPGDVVVKRDGFTLYFPIVTCIILSVVGSLILYFISRR